MHRLPLWTLRVLGLAGLLTFLVQGPKGLAATGIFLGFWALGEVLHRIAGLLHQVVLTNQEVKALLLVEERHGNQDTSKLSQGV